MPSSEPPRIGARFHLADFGKRFEGVGVPLQEEGSEESHHLRAHLRRTAYQVGLSKEAVAAEVHGEGHGFFVAYHHARVTHDCFTGDGNSPAKRSALISLSIVVDKLLDVKPGARPDFSPITTDSTFQDALLQNAMSVSTMCLQRVQCVYYSLVTDYVGTLYHVQHSDFCVWPTTFLPEGQSEQANN